MRLRWAMGGSYGERKISLAVWLWYTDRGESFFFVQQIIMCLLSSSSRRHSRRGEGMTENVEKKSSRTSLQLFFFSWSMVRGAIALFRKWFGRSELSHNRWSAVDEAWDDVQAINAALNEGSYEGAKIIWAKRLGSDALERRRGCLQDIQLSVQLG